MIFSGLVKIAWCILFLSQKRIKKVLQRYVFRALLVPI